jgi:hypothetical protein
MFPLVNPLPRAPGEYLFVQAYIDDAPCLRVAPLRRDGVEGHANVLGTLLREAGIAAEYAPDYAHDYRFIPERAGSRYALAGVGILRVDEDGRAYAQRDTADGQVNFRDYWDLTFDQQHWEAFESARRRRTSAN